MNVDLLFLSWNRKEFVEQSFTNLLAATDWDLVNALHVIDDGSTDGALETMYELIHRSPVEYHLHERPNEGPVEAMNFYVAQADSDWFFKCDSDIMLPKGYLPAMLDVIGSNRDIDALGTEAGRTQLPPLDAQGIATVRPEPGFYSFEHGSHIGGVGLIRTECLGRRPRLIPNGHAGRFGWTEWQSQWKIGRGWIQPDLPVTSLDQVPFDPWQRYAKEYVKKGWARPWSQYHARWMARYWNWWMSDEIGES